MEKNNECTLKSFDKVAEYDKTLAPALDGILEIAAEMGVVLTIDGVHVVDIDDEGETQGVHEFSAGCHPEFRIGELPPHVELGIVTEKVNAPAEKAYAILEYVRENYGRFINALSGDPDLLKAHFDKTDTLEKAARRTVNRHKMELVREQSTDAVIDHGDKNV